MRKAFHRGFSGSLINSSRGQSFDGDYSALRSAVLADGGEIDSDYDLNSYIRMAKANGIYDSILFGMLGAYNIRTSGNTKYVTKGYSMDSVPNDATQTTEASQPYLTGFIAPNEKWGLKNPNGGSRYMTHPTISFAANEAWSVSFVCNPNNVYSVSAVGDAVSNVTFNSSGFIGINNSVPTFYLSNVSVKDYCSKNLIVTLVADGESNLSIYLNGQPRENIAAVTSFIFSWIFRGRTLAFNGSISAHFIRNIALTPTQVAAEATKLRQIFPEIPSVSIGSVNIASSNLEVVASSNGTAIPNVTDNATWALGNAAWVYHNNDPAIGSLYGNLYNKAARDIVIANPPSGWHVATEAELTSIATNGGNALKYGGTDYWNTTGGTNTTGFTALGGSSRNADGTFNTIKDHAGFWCADSDKVLKVYHDSDVAEVVSVTSVNEGFSIRLVKD